MFNKKKTIKIKDFLENDYAHNPDIGEAIGNYILENNKELKNIELDFDDNNNELDAAISFYIISSVNAKIQYNYCLSTELCDSEDNIYKKDKKIVFEKNRIDDKWNSIWDCVKNM